MIRQFDIVQPDGTVLKPYAEVDYKTSGGWDSYNALQVGLARRFSSGVTLNSQYTYGKSRRQHFRIERCFDVGERKRQ